MTMQVLSEEEVWFRGPAHKHVSAELAGLCCRGPMPCGHVDDSTPVTWQLIRGAAVADPQVLQRVTLCLSPFSIEMEDSSQTSVICRISGIKEWYVF